MSQADQPVYVLGAGNFGTCLAQHLADQGNNVVIYARDNNVVTSINENHRNPKHLTSLSLSKRVQATNKITPELLQGAKAIVMVIPTQFMRQELEKLKNKFPEDVLFVAANKGIEIESKQLPYGIIEDVLGKKISEQTVFLSGPSFAAEVALRQPTAVAVASKSKTAAQKAQALFHAAHFRTYTSDDPIGLEVAGALKNVIAIASGACDGIGYQMNSRAALLTRGLAEITRIGVKLGANPLTFNGLGGVGDLFLTCTSPKSRNYTVGYRLGKGENIEGILATMDSVAEGVATAKAAKNLAEDLGVSAPIIEQVYKVLYEQKPITQAVTDLITREAKPEIDLS